MAVQVIDEDGKIDWSFLKNLPANLLYFKSQGSKTSSTEINSIIYLRTQDNHTYSLAGVCACTCTCTCNSQCCDHSKCFKF